MGKLQFCKRCRPSVFALVTAAHSLVHSEFQHQTSFDANADATSPPPQGKGKVNSRGHRKLQTAKPMAR